MTAIKKTSKEEVKSDKWFIYSKTKNGLNAGLKRHNLDYDPEDNYIGQYSFKDSVMREMEGAIVVIKDKEINLNNYIRD